MSSFVDSSPAPTHADPSVGPVSAPSLADALAGDTGTPHSEPQPNYEQILTEFSDSSGQNSIEAEADRQLAESVGQDAGASPVAEQGNTASAPPSSPAAQPLDPNTQAMLGMFQQMQNDGARREQLLLAQIEALKPRPAPVAPIDPFADLPEKFNTPEIKEFLKVAQDKILSPYQKQMEARIQEAQHTRLTNQYASEAEQAAQAVISSGYDLSGQDAAIVKDGLRDFALTLSHVHGGTPSQYKDALARVADSLVRGRQAHMNKTAKAK